MPAPTQVDKARMNAYLRKHGMGALDDPSVLDQLAFFVRSESKFKEVLARLAPADRALCYRALAPRISFFKPRPLADYEVEIHREAENLPVIDNKTWAVTEASDARISEEAKQAISGKSLEERQAAKLVETAEDAIAESIGQTQARGRLEIECTKCGFTALVYAQDRTDAYQTLVAAGWIVSADRAYCPACEAPAKDSH